MKLPRGSKKLDWEVELGIVIGNTRALRAGARGDGLRGRHCVCNDVSEREFQIERAGTWDKGKGCDVRSDRPVGGDETKSPIRRRCRCGPR